MTTIQCQFTSDFTPPTVIKEWWSTFGMANGLQLPHPLAEGEGSTCGGYKDNLWLNLELWRNPVTDTSICRLSAESTPFESVTVVDTLKTVAKSLQAPPLQAVSESAFASDAFTWIGGWDWIDDGAPDHWTLSQSEAARKKAPSGLCAQDGSSMGTGTKNAKWGFVDAPRRVVYLGFEYLPKTDGDINLVIVEGTNAVPISSVPGVSILRNRTCAYSACLSSDGSLIAQIEYLRGNGYISLVSTADGSTRSLTWFEHASGGEAISFSPDDKWLLVPGYRGALIINTETGRSKPFTEFFHSSCWWVREGHLGLLTIGRGQSADPDYDPFVVDFHDFATGSTVEVVRIIPADRISSRSSWIWGATPSTEGTLLVNMLVPDSVDPEESYLSLTKVDLRTGVLTPVVDIFVEPEHKIRRKQDKWYWNSPMPNTITVPPTMLLDGFTEASTADWPEFEDDKYGAMLRIEFGSPLFQVSK